MRFQRVEYMTKYLVVPNKLCAFSAVDMDKRLMSISTLCPPLSSSLPLRNKTTESQTDPRTAHPPKMIDLSTFS
jgi:hypothetical protein